VSSETPAEIDSVLDAAFGEIEKHAAPAAPAKTSRPAPVKSGAPKSVPPEQVVRPAIDRAPIESEAEEPISPAPPATPLRKSPEPPKPAPVAHKPVPVAPKPAPVVQPPTVLVQPPPKVEEEPAQEEPVAPRRSVPGYDPFVELRTLEPKSSRRAAPTGDDFRPYWQRYPARSVGVAGAVAAVVLIAVMLLGRGGSKHARAAARAGDTTSVASHAAAGDPPPAAGDTPTGAQPDTQNVASPEDTPDTASAPAPQPTAISAPSSSNETSVARPVGPGDIAPIQRTDVPAASPSTSHLFARPKGS